ncbi:MAG: hypothetical protein ACXAC8_02195 [Candidatus Hodarchaeales archaeon]|jgi:hypothetical protein
MPKHIEQEAINRLSSAGSVLKNPYKSLEEVLTGLGKLNQNLQTTTDKKYEVNVSAPVDNSLDNSNNILRKVLVELGKMFKVCQICEKKTVKDELISGVCIDCYQKREQIQAENENIIFVVKDYMTDIWEEIRELQSEISKFKKKVNNTPPPPPPPSFLDSNDKLSPNNTEINFMAMELEEIKKFTPEFLETLPIDKRNQYNVRLKELQEINRMTPEERRKYFENKRQEQAQIAKVEEFREAMKNLGEINNPLFEKMKKQADDSSLQGSGTLGIIGPKSVFVHCYNCNETNEILEGEEVLCKSCETPLSIR